MIRTDVSIFDGFFSSLSYTEQNGEGFTLNNFHLEITCKLNK